VVNELRPVRRFPIDVRDDYRPVRLPHLETDGETTLFMGEEIDVFPPGSDELWATIDGARALSAWDKAARSTIRDWHRNGLLVMAPPQAEATPSYTVLSPHPDDAQLALGGLLARDKGRVVAVFTQETWTRRPYYRARPGLTASLLLAEERAACTVLGADLVLLNHVDAEARPAWSSGFFVEGRDVTAAEPDLFAAVVADLESVLKDTQGPVFTPLGIGGHVDHLMIREAARRLVHEDRLVYYEDMPYTVYGDAPAAAVGLTPALLTADAHTADVKREALWCYRLQVTEATTTRVVRHGTRLGADAFAERVWHTEGASALV
jgi:LmbE family N-acetylglucosaminyl deacetylase